MQDILFIILSLLQTLVFVAYSLPLPIFPAIAMSKSVSKEIIGLIFACYPITHLITSFVFGQVINKWSRKRIIINCIIFLAISTVLFGLVDLIEHRFLFIIISMISRLFQGCGVAGYNVVCFAMFPKLYPDSLQEKLGYFAICCGLGIGIGPILGGYLENLMNYEFVFFFVAFLYIVIIFFLNTLLDKYPDLSNNEEIEIEVINDIGYMSFGKNLEFMLTIGNQLFAIIGLMLLYPILGDRINSLGGDTLTIAYAFAINTLSYSGIVLISNLFNVSQILNRKLSISLGQLLCILALYYISSSENINSILFAMGLMGFGHFFVLLPQIPEFIEIGSHFESNMQRKEDKINDLSSALFNAAFGLSEFIGPILGGFLDEFLGFSKGIYAFIILNIIFWIVYMILGGGLQSIKKPCVTMEELEKKNLRDSSVKIFFRSTPSPRSSIIRKSEHSLSPTNEKGGKINDYFQEIQKKLIQK